MENNMCKCPHHKVVPVLIILFGLTFLLEALGVLTAGFAGIVWPIIIIAGGLMKWMTKSGMCKCC
ncbi:MAG: hypothetical protein Q7S77_00220 [Candidatus Staskawiczbacteria bacterium]|nr:hypothetical protein [Candidatus Staskawiczbacteria bacterium]